MSFLDNISKTIGQSIDRAKFEADKFQKTNQIRGELSELRKKIDAQRLDLSDKATELYRAGQIQSVTLGEMIQSIDALRAQITLKEEELKSSQAVAPPTAPTGTDQSAQSVPVSVEPPTQPFPQATPPAQVTPQPAEDPASATKACPHCQFQMPKTSLFCPSCGARVNQ
ncbi:MAG: zinc-ribbon domain-containing protein [Chloroflexota bacterium]